MDNLQRNKIIFFSVSIISIISAILIFNILKKDDDKIKLNGFFSKNKEITLNIISKTGNEDGFFSVASKSFMEKNKNIKINFISQSTFGAIDYILKGNDVNAWICSDETAVDILKNRYSTQNQGKDIVLYSSPIVTSPLVIVGWEDRLNVIGDLSISKLYNLVSSGKTWSSIGGDPNWGFFNFSHTDPTQSNSGIQFIELLIYNYYSSINNAKKSLEISDVSNEALMKSIKKFEQNSRTVDEGSGKFIQDFILYGPSRCDLGAIYEYYALSNIKYAQSRWGNLKIIYPNPTIWSNKPFVVLGGNSSKEQITASKQFMDYLLSSEIQNQAMKEGFRPANPQITNLDIMHDEFAKFGYKKDIPSAVPPPNINVIENIISMIKRVKNMSSN